MEKGEHLEGQCFDYISNLNVACRRCNSSKSNKDLNSWKGRKT
jgi:hypothetical protein